MLYGYMYKCYDSDAEHELSNGLYWYRVTWLALVLGLLPSPTNGLHEIGLCNLFTAREVSSSNLRVDLHARIRWEEMVWDIVSLVNGDARLDDGVVFPK